MRGLACGSLLCLAMAGCGMFDKKPAQNQPLGSRNPSGGGVTPTGGNGVAIADRGVPPPRVGGILAGQVLDSFNRKPPPTRIQIVSLQGKEGGAAAAPIEVSADNQGYFTIQGLQPGQSYQLIARAKDGDRTLVGRAYARPPKPNLLIALSEDASEGTNKQASGSPGIDHPAASLGAPPGREDDGLPRGVEIGPPIRGDGRGEGRPFDADNNAPLRPEQIVDDPRTTLPRININHQPPDDSPRDDGPGVDGPSSRRNGEATPVPSCQLVGNKLENFALNDLEGAAWEFRKDRKGRLVLLDFWGTWCGPCQQAVRHLVALNNKYKSFGLEIVGITEEYPSEDGRDPAGNVRGVCRRLDVNYKVLMGEGVTARCPVKSQFGVSKFPTMVLLDDTGKILWRSEGLSPEKARELDLLIRKQLRIRDERD